VAKRPESPQSRETDHRFRCAISNVNSGKFRVPSEAEQKIQEDCSRLIANVIKQTVRMTKVLSQRSCAS
jgi:hypothetical protein